MKTRCFGLIPSRYGSTRLPGKPLANIAGKPLFWHVWNRARQCPELESVTLATDDTRIAEAAANLGVPCVMTGADHQSGTDRIHEAARLLGLPLDAVVVNIQGDEPLVEPSLVSALLAPFAEAKVRVTTVVSPISMERAQNPNQVKAVLDKAGNALYFSRAAIPFVRNADADPGYLGHIGLYAFRMDALRDFVSLPPSRLEGLEKLEQLRFLENGIPIRAVRVDHHAPGIDTPEDLERVRALFAHAVA